MKNRIVRSSAFTQNFSPKLPLFALESATMGTRKSIFALMLLATIFLPSALNAASISWTGGSTPPDTFWDTPANWSTGNVPTDQDDVTIDVKVNVIVKSAAFCKSLNISGDSGF